ncbi:hypothetical protein [Seohaeicola zhoushanensis]|uniref:Uncharacterized protein n=1 Tax=Seohaeicola zhoushanensis TaxID=1569283 RepID=A0A8J3M8Y1_9RHOB|nr:hypothetical protein [Seohaeicola zhoushanensis]GHF55919.1 hypothetical protein GCM10017056_29330 [Seohaeicola zhoushanensis]
MRIRWLAIALILPLPAAGQTPLSAIEWLGKNSPTVRTGPVLTEPPVSRSATHPQIDVRPLQALADPVGLVPASVTGLPQELWQESDGKTLATQVASVPVRRYPAMQTLLYTLLLSETRPPETGGEALLLARLDRLVAMGAVEPAQTLAETAGASSNPQRFRRWFDATLLTGEEDKGCAELSANPTLLPDYGARIFCAVRAGDWETGALLLEAAHALELLPEAKLNLLDRFLSPEVFEGAPALPAPAAPDPLTFRLFETIGEPLPTTTLPVAFAAADLRDLAGWKAQLEAAERLTRTGALPPNRLLGLYTERDPAASGGIWDRVQALQRFETALDHTSISGVEKTLPAVWQAMEEAQIETAFATLFAERLAGLTLEDPAARAVAWRIQLLSADYEAAAQTPPDDSALSLFLAALAQGRPGEAPAPTQRAQAIANGFAPDAALPERVREALEAGRLGEAILRAMDYFDRGARGNPVDLSGAIAAMRLVGLEDLTRRACLQLMLLKRSGA